MPSPAAGFRWRGFESDACYDRAMEGDLAIFERGVNQHRKIFRVFMIIGLVLIGGFVLDGVLEVAEIGFDTANKPSRLLLFTGGGMALLVFWLANSYRKHKGIRLLENPDQLKSYKVMLLGQTDQISAIWVRNEKGTNYELPLVVDTIEEGHRALAALQQAAPHAEAETPVRLV